MVRVAFNNKPDHNKKSLKYNLSKILLKQEIVKLGNYIFDIVYILFMKRMTLFQVDRDDQV